MYEFTSAHLRRAAERLSSAQRDFIIQHVDGPAPIIAGKNSGTRQTMVERGFVFETGSCCSGRGRPPVRAKFTILTDRGREMLAIILALEAERLVALGCTDPAVPPVTLAPAAEERDHDEPVDRSGSRVRGLASA